MMLSPPQQGMATTFEPDDEDILPTSFGIAGPSPGLFSGSAGFSPTPVLSRLAQPSLAASSGSNGPSAAPPASAPVHPDSYSVDLVSKLRAENERLASRAQVLERQWRADQATLNQKTAEIKMLKRDLKAFDLRSNEKQLRLDLMAMEMEYLTRKHKKEMEGMQDRLEREKVQQTQQSTASRMAKLTPETTVDRTLAHMKTLTYADQQAQGLAPPPPPPPPPGAPSSPPAPSFAEQSPEAPLAKSESRWMSINKGVTAAYSSAESPRGHRGDDLAAISNAAHKNSKLHAGGSGEEEGGGGGGGRGGAADASKGGQNTPRGEQIQEEHTAFAMAFSLMAGISESITIVHKDFVGGFKSGDFQESQKFMVPEQVTGVKGRRHKYEITYYAPQTFAVIRDKSGVVPAEFRNSFASEHYLREFDTPGKSKSHFFFTENEKFVIKTISHTELKDILKMLKSYVAHLEEHRNTFLCKFYGVYKLEDKGKGGKTDYFVVMNNVFPAAAVGLHERFDLKGSVVGRKASAKERLETCPVLKDLDWTAEPENKRQYSFFVRPDLRKKINDQLQADCQFLTGQQFMDYSLLVGIHDETKAGKSGEGTVQSRRRKSVSLQSLQAGGNSPALLAKLPSSSDNAGRGQTRDDDWRQLGQESDGAIRGIGSCSHMKFYVGIIDILQVYNLSKKTENMFKSMMNKAEKISSVNPDFYAKRFCTFMKDEVINEKDILALGAPMPSGGSLSELPEGEEPANQPRNAKRR